MDERGKRRGEISADPNVEGLVYQVVDTTENWENGQTKQGSSRGKKARGQTGDAPGKARERQRAGITVVERRLLKQPDEIRRAARDLSERFKAQANELRNSSSKPNEPDRLAQFEGLLSFFEQMAAGLADLADALDQAFATTASAGSQPFFIGKAAKIARALERRVQQLLEEIGTEAIGFPIRISVLLAGIYFLHSIGADSLAAVSALGFLIRPRRKGATTKKAPSSRKKKGQPLKQ